MPKNPLLHPSGVNSSFHGGDGDFQDYIQHMQNVIALGRIDLNAQNREKIILANSPFEWRPDNPTKKGILLIHGIYDSPFTLQDIGRCLLKKNFLVRSVLLPGHGTVPGDLLNIHYSEWVKATHFALASLRKEVDEIYILGYSLGGTLAIHEFLENPEKVNALILLAPALKPRHHLADLLINIHKVTSLFFESQNWYQRTKQTSYARYESFPCDAAQQACALMKIVLQKIQQQSINIPIFMVVDQDDESVNPDVAISFFLKEKNSNNQMLLYSNNAELFTDNRIIVRQSAYPEQKILDLAHSGLPMSPDNPHYGKNGEFKDFQHYHYNLKKHPGEIYLGAITQKNLRKHVIQRLSYNPDFAGMTSLLNQFIDKVDS